jgi:hypothetical protein
MDIHRNPRTIEIKRIIQASVNLVDRGRVRISEPKQRQLEGFIAVDNFDSLCVSDLVHKLPRGTRLFARAVTRVPFDVVLSRVEIYYSTEDGFWKLRKFIMFVVWLVAPILLSFACVLNFNKGP